MATTTTTRHGRSHARRSVLVLGAVMALGAGSLSACSKSDPAANQADTTGPTATSNASNTSSTTLAPATTITTLAPGTTAVTSSTMARPAVPMTIIRSTDGTSPDGSGCTPPAGDSLPDGIWFGITKSVDTSEPSLMIDLACFFSGPAATKAAGRTPDNPIENDYFIQNENPKQYRVALAENVDVLRLQHGGGSSEYEPTVTGPGEAEAAAAGALDSFLTWIAVSDHKVVVLQQQFVP